MPLSISLIGGGSFGTALAVHLAKKGYEVKIWDRSEDVVNSINLKRRNPKYLSEISLPHNINAYCDVKDALAESQFVILSVPSSAVRNVTENIKGYIRKDQVVISIAKGIEYDSHKRMSEVIKEELPYNDVVVMSGPSHAEEVVLNMPTAVVVSSVNIEASKKVQDLLFSERFRVYTNPDICGVEIGGAYKNIIALAAGISDGIGFEDNTKAALMTRGMSEIIRIGLKLGGKIETFSGLAGIGDLIVTCTSMHSRNRRAGILIGKGNKVEDAVKEIGMVVEGIDACRAFYALKEKLKVSMPITDGLYKVLFENMDPKACVHDLMTRDMKEENYY